MGSATEREIRWVESAWQRRITRVRRLTGGCTSTMLGLTGHDGEQAVLRLMTKEPWRRHAAGLLSREAAVQHQLQRSSIPAPRSVALDLSGDSAGAPAHLMSWLPGRLCLTSAADGILEAMAQVLVSIHQFAPGRDRPRQYQSWAAPDKQSCRRGRSGDSSGIRRSSCWTNPYRPMPVRSCTEIFIWGICCGRRGVSAASWTGSRHRGDRRPWTWHMPRPTSRCCTALRLEPDSRTRTVAGLMTVTTRTSAGTGTSWTLSATCRTR